MIKIEIDNILNLQLEYQQAVAPKVRKRLFYLQTALDHILGNSDVQPLPKHHPELVSVIKKIVKLILNESLTDMELDVKNYDSTILSYRSKLINGTGINFRKVLDLVEYLGDTDNKRLEYLLTCPATDLCNVNRELTTYPNKLSQDEISFLKIAFDYTSYASVSSEIKAFFREKNFVTYCPYCNQDPAMYSGLTNGKSARVHQLDHFYDKATRPLLCYSLFNLVPGDWICNAVNKGSKKFRDRWHLNPYIDGFGKTMVFEPDFDEVGAKMIKIELVVDQSADLNKRKQLLGSKLRIHDSDTKGNINVFALHNKYNTPHVRLEAGRVHQKFLNNLKNMSSLKGFLNQLPENQAFDQYKYWYEQEIRAPFESRYFNDQRYSKLFRDIHDFVVDKEKSPDNYLIQQLSKKYQ